MMIQIGMIKMIEITKPNKDLKPSEISNFLVHLKKEKIKEWSFYKSSQCFIGRFAFHSNKTIWVRSNGEIQVGNIILCRSEEFRNDLLSRLHKREGQLESIERKMKKQAEEKTLNIIRDLGQK